MTLYLDTSVVIALLTLDPHSARAERLVEDAAPPFLSDLAAVEFAAVIARRVRMRLLNDAEARTVCLSLDRWAADLAVRTEVEATDYARAAAVIRRFDLTLRTQDALHIATAQRLGATLATFDTAMAHAARALGVDIAAA